MARTCIRTDFEFVISAETMGCMVPSKAFCISSDKKKSSHLHLLASRAPRWKDAYDSHGYSLCM